ncbi:MAG: hypothetical protein BGO26_04750 [Actinobacteria bacterium 69-20]|jgi:arylsulfatase A-like enzyme|nr:hypothetical protein [Actinomycetota bacterium]OJV26905.1 MAG: hypothetical protein BGO26_04750 [Actinobacteria bacterium 69-20]
MKLRTHRSTALAVLAIAATAAGVVIAAPAADARTTVPTTRPAAHTDSTAPCSLANGVKHVVQIMFDNVHLTRDNPNVPSDLEQMPALYDFLTHNGVMMANDHNVLVHTATNFISNFTGLYPDRTAITQSNSGSYYAPDGSTHPNVSFAYWTDPVYDYTNPQPPLDPNYNLQYTANRRNVPNHTNVNVPAPWVPFTRAGCNVGEVGMANTVLENTGSDITTVFGENSPEAAEATANPHKAQADFVGYAVHCAARSSLCATGQTDALPDEPGGYHGFKGLFGNAQIQPVISPSGSVKALDGTTIQDQYGNVGFPGFDSLTPTNSLGYAAQMLENGVQDVNVYVSDVHSDHTGSAGDLGPGSQLYEQQLAAYNAAFAQFFQRLATDHITPSNTLFVVTTDEGDHFSGSAPTPTGCTGAPGNYCSYATSSEVNVNLPGLLASATGNTTPFAIHSDPAPALWVKGQPARTDPAVRQLARDIASLHFKNPLTGATEPVAYYMADPVEEKILHFVSSDPARTPTMTLFSGEDSYVTTGKTACTGDACAFTTSAGFAWNHGSSWPDMQDIWAGYVGPGISARGTNRTVFTDQVDMRPTVLALTGLHDDYAVDGRVLTEIAAPGALPKSLRAHADIVRELGEEYKQILATTGKFDMTTLKISTKGLASGSTTNDRRYRATEAALTWLDNQRDRLAAQMSDQLLGAAFHGTPVQPEKAQRLIAQAKALLKLTDHLAAL